MVTIHRPVGSTGKTFPYSFEFNCKDPSLPTVIHIPGGPGLPSIGSDPLSNVNANIIATDPRGSGSNSAYWSNGGTDTDHSTERVADDIIAIVSHLRLKNYSLHGSSFGTAVATIAVSKMEAAKSPYLPNSLILEGVVGRAGTENEQNAATRRIFQEIKTEAGFCVTCKLDSLQGPLSQTQIGNLMEALQSLGKDTAVKVVRNASSEQLITMAKENSKPLGPNELRVYNAIACHEYFVNGITDTPYSKGELNVSSGGSCKDKKLDRPYDSKAWQVKTKIYYIVGSSDNFTPVTQAKYHADNQKNANRNVLCISRGGHTPLKYNVPKCSPHLFKRMLAGANINAEDLSACDARVQTDSFECEK